MARPLTRRLPALLVPALALAGCGGDSPSESEATSFGRLHARVLAPSCASCHTEGSARARQSGLVLDAAVAYDNLIGALPTNANARADGMQRVVPGNADRSLLYHKLHFGNDHHAGRYGNPMPLGGPPLSLGQVEFLRQWIEAGAPRGGDAIDAILLDDRTAPPPDTFVPLPPPARGVQLRIEPFAVRPRFEREIFVYKRVGNPAELYISRVETRMRPSSHHLLIQTFAPQIPPSLVPPHDVVRDIRNPDGTLIFANLAPMAYHVFLAGSMTQANDYAFPPGVALRLPAGASLDLNTHYVNRGSYEIPGEAYINLHTVERSQVQRVASTLNLPNFDIRLLARQRTTLTRTFLAGTDLPLGPDSTTRVFALTSHMHALGERFVIRVKGGARDGEVVYTSTDWEHPELRFYEAPIVLRRGEGLTSEITWNNTRDRTVSFGLTSEDEMGIIFGYHY